jgi:hypothetical protein
MVTATFINRLSHAIDLLEQQTQPKPWKTVQVRRGWREDGRLAIDRHFAAHPEDRDADIVLFHFCDDPLADKDQVSATPAGATRKDP